MADKKKRKNLSPLFRYWRRAKDDPLRVSILAAHALIEELIENVIAEAVPNSDCFEVPKMRFWQKLKVIKALDSKDRDRLPEGHMLWKCIEKLTDLRNAAAHRDYERKRDELFNDFADFFYPDPAFRAARSREHLLQESTEICAGILIGMKEGTFATPRRV